MVNNLVVQYVNWTLKKQNKTKKKQNKTKKKLLLPLYLKKKVWKKEKSIRSMDLKSLSIMSITILNNQLDGSLASDTPVFPKNLSFQSICPIFTTFLTIVALCKSIWKNVKFKISFLISDLKSRFNFWLQNWNLYQISVWKTYFILDIFLGNFTYGRMS